MMQHGFLIIAILINYTFVISTTYASDNKDTTVNGSKAATTSISGQLPTEQLDRNNQKQTLHTPPNGTQPTQTKPINTDGYASHKPSTATKASQPSSSGKKRAANKLIQRNNEAKKKSGITNTQNTSNSQPKPDVVK